MTQVTWVTAFISDLGLDRAWEAGDIVSQILPPHPIQKGFWNLVEVELGEMAEKLSPQRILCGEAGGGGCCPNSWETGGEDPALISW